MKLKNTLITGLAVAALAAIAMSTQVSGTTTRTNPAEPKVRIQSAFITGSSVKTNAHDAKVRLENAIASHIQGAWKVDGAVTRRVNPDPVLLAWVTPIFTADKHVIDRMTREIHRLNLTGVFSSGILTMHAGRGIADVPYVLFESGDDVMLLWWTTAPDGTYVHDMRVVNLIPAADPAHDLLFIGSTDRMRGLGVCFDRITP
jgi:hypothetical protein